MKKIPLFSLKINKEEIRYFPYYFLVGFISVLAQTILLRELVVEVFGNEIIYSIFLSTWLLLVASGSLIYRIFPLKKGFHNVVYILLSLLVLLIPFQFLFIRYFVEQISVISGMIINISSLFILAFVILSPGCLVIGYLFPVNANLHAKFTSAVKKVYIFESLGMMFGGILFYILIHIFQGFTILILAGLISLLLLFILGRRRIFIFGLIIFILLAFFSQSIFRSHYKTRYEPEKLLASYDSKYGRFDITKSHNQKNYFWDGVLFANSENENYAEEMVGFVLLQHPKPKNLLLAGGLLNDYPEQFLKYPEIEIDYLEIDKNVLKASDYSSSNDSRVDLIQKDALLYLNQNEKKYDIVYFDMPDPSSLFLNRFYTAEFFELVNLQLRNENSLVAITVSNAENYMVPELEKLNRTIYKSLKNSFENVVFVPAQKIIYIASQGEFITNNVSSLVARMGKNNLKGEWFNRSLIFDTCNEFRINKIKDAISSKNSPVNKILRPAAFLSTIQYWFKHQDKSVSRQIDFIKNNKTIAFIFVFLLIVFLAFISKSESPSLYGIINNSIIVSTSLVAFVMQIILLYLFQVYYGYIYYVIAVFTASFMLGLTTGFVIKSKFKKYLSIILLFNTLFLIFILFLIDYKINPIFYFIFNFILSVLEGMILSGVLNTDKGKDEKRGAAFYFADTIGAFLGGIIFGVVLLPIYGIKLNIKFLALIIFINFILSLIYLIKVKQKKAVT